jgi:hypothetical protein
MTRPRAASFFGALLRPGLPGSANSASFPRAEVADQRGQRRRGVPEPGGGLGQGRAIEHVGADRLIPALVHPGRPAEPLPARSRGWFHCHIACLPSVLFDRPERSPRGVSHRHRRIHAARRRDTRGYLNWSSTRGSGRHHVSEPRSRARNSYTVPEQRRPGARPAKANAHVRAGPTTSREQRPRQQDEGPRRCAEGRANWPKSGCRAATARCS